MKGFSGVFPRDTLPNKIIKGQSSIINYNSSAEPGSHWVAVYNGGGDTEFFDSFGVVPGKEIQRYMKTSGKKTTYNHGQIQNSITATCGYFCIAFLLERQRGVSYYDFIDQFDETDTWGNEQKLRELFPHY